MMRWHRRLYDWVLAWASHPSATAVLFLLALAESSFFPVPPDVLLAAMVLAARSRALWLVTVCAAGSVLGGALGYLIGWGFWEVTAPFFYDWVPGFDEPTYERVAALYERWNFWVVFAAGFTPIPYKVFTIGAGVARISFPTFLIASLVGRTARFALVGALFAVFGPPIRSFVERYLGWVSLAFTLLLVGGFVAVKYLL